jgi:hypothetical protein
MLLHFVFVIRREDLGKRDFEFEYVKQMAQFYKKWVKDVFSQDVDIQCDEMVTDKAGILKRLDTTTLLEDHRMRGIDTFHFYLTHFRPMWTDCNCEGYYAENFAVTLWQKPKDKDDILFLAEKNCTLVSHELAHVFLMQKKFKKHAETIHDTWSKHIFNALKFEHYEKSFARTQEEPYFMTIDTSDLVIV